MDVIVRMVGGISADLRHLSLKVGAGMQCASQIVEEVEVGN